jgi:uncharacterized protein YebE (UPF0316 family)
MPETLFWTAVIFVSRLVSVALGTIRVQFIGHQRKLPAALIGFFEMLIYVQIIGHVVQNIQNWPYVLALAGGFATGTLLGIPLFGRIFPEGVVRVTIMPQAPWREVEAAIRQVGFALTCQEGMGRDGPVEVFTVVCSLRKLPMLTETVKGVDARAFLYIHRLSSSRGGYIYGLKGKL